MKKTAKNQGKAQALGKEAIKSAKQIVRAAKQQLAKAKAALKQAKLQWKAEKKNVKRARKKTQPKKPAKSTKMASVQSTKKKSAGSPVSRNKAIVSSKPAAQRLKPKEKAVKRPDSASASGADIARGATETEQTPAAA